MKADKRYVVKNEENNYSLTISETKTADKGKFKAIFKNKCGQIETDANLNITCK